MYNAQQYLYPTVLYKYSVIELAQRFQYQLTYVRTKEICPISTGCHRSVKRRNLRFSGDRLF